MSNSHLLSLKRKPNHIVTGIAIFMLFNSNSAFAYLDPGTGSMMLQGLIALIASIAGAASFYWARIKSFFCKSKKTTMEQSSKEKV
jgi:hypothetical protein